MQAELYRHAITLNNVGVHLLQRGAAKQALDTLRNAVDAFRVSCDPHMTQDLMLGPKDLAAAMSQRIQRALGHVANPVTTGKILTVELLCWEEANVGASRSLSTAASSFGTQCWATFSMSPAVDVSERDREFDSALLMYNYALAHLAYMNDQNAEAVKRSALSLFRMAFSILFSKIEEGVEGDLWESVSMESATALTVAVLTNLAYIFSSEGATSEASACQEKLEEIFETLAAVEEINSVCLHAVVAAPAA